jgi:copper oxidase (laccase) domain-containing protein
VEAVPAGSCDGLVSSDPSLALSVLTADCASIALGSPEGVFGAVHAGWRGLAGGVVEAAVAAMRAAGATEVVGALGPCIHAGCYEFSEGDLDDLAGAYGPGVVGSTTAGRPALDLPATVSAALAAGGATETAGIDTCTACAGGYFSHRARRDTGRQAMVVWSDGGAEA